MARTRAARVKAAQQQATGDAQSSSENDDVGIPNTRQRKRLPPSKTVPTLRQTPARPAQPAKRRADEAQMDASPSEAKKRRRQSRGGPIAKKAGDGDETVNLAALEAMNHLSKRTRRGGSAQKSEIRIDIPTKKRQTRQNTAAAKVAPEAHLQQATVMDNSSDGEDMHGAEITAEEQQLSLQQQQEAPAPSHQTASDAPSNRHVDQRPPPSGQGDLMSPATQQAAASQTPKRKSTQRMPKVALEDRVRSEMSLPRTSASSSKASHKQPATQDYVPRDLTESPVIPQLERPSIQLQDGLRHDQHRSDLHPRGRLSQVPEAPFEEDEYEDTGAEDEDTDEHLEPSNMENARDSLSNLAVEIIDSQPAVQVPVRELATICRVMGYKAWTGYGKRWILDLLDHRIHGLDNPRQAPPSTRPARACWKHLVSLRDLYKDAPRSSAMARQIHFLTATSDKTEKLIARVGKYVDQMCAAALALDVIEFDQDHLLQDLVQYIIPLLVVVLRQFFLLGGITSYENGQPDLPNEHGSFTSTSLQLLARISLWLRRLHAPIERQTVMKWGRASLREDDEVDDAPSPSQGDAKAKATIPGGRVKLGKIIKIFHREILRAIDRVKMEVEREIQRQKKRERDAKVRAERERMAREALQRSQERYESFVASTQQLREHPSPLDEMWFKAQEEEERRLAERQQRSAQRERERQRASSQLGSPQLGGFLSAQLEMQEVVRLGDIHGEESEMDSSDFETPIQQTAPAPAPALGEALPAAEPWDEEESKWLLKQLKMHYQNPEWNIWAEDVLERPVAEVKQEAELLKIATRSIARETGQRIPDWAQSVTI